MPRSGRFTIVSDFSPKQLLELAEEIAVDSRCGIEDFDRDDRRRGFHIYDAKGERQVYTLLSPVTMAAGGDRVPLDMDIFADRDKHEDGRLTIDWVETGSSLRPRVCERFAESFADEVQERIKVDGGVIISTDDEAD
jgi:hypothetical protein